MSARPFKGIEEMNLEIIEQINSTVSIKDTLYMLGDICWKSTFAKFRKLIKCKDLHLIWGNHDRKSFAQCFKAATDTRMIKLADGEKCFLSHYAHAYWPASHRNAYHVYGHTHTQREETLDSIWPDRRSMDVGVDNAYEILGVYRPFSEYEIIDILGKRKGHDLPEFYKDFQVKLHKRRKKG